MSVWRVMAPRLFTIVARTGVQIGVINKILNTPFPTPVAGAGGADWREAPDEAPPPYVPRHAR